MLKVKVTHASLDDWYKEGEIYEVSRIARNQSDPGFFVKNHLEPESFIFFDDADLFEESQSETSPRCLLVRGKEEAEVAREIIRSLQLTNAEVIFAKEKPKAKDILVSYRLAMGDEKASIFYHQPVNLPNPTREEQESPVFNAIWKTIRKWDINIGDGPQGATGSHVKVIMDAVNEAGIDFVYIGSMKDEKHIKE